MCYECADVWLAAFCLLWLQLYQLSQLLTEGLQRSGAAVCETEMSEISAFLI